MVSVKSDYALHAVFDLASRRSRDPVKIADIARRQKIPQKFLELILANLKQGGFVESRRGAEGGYLLARPPGQITVGEVLQYVEGGQNGPGRKRDDSPFSGVWKRVDEAAAHIYGATTFEALTREWEDRQSRFVANWEI